jgi:F-type H+-transporting ATPase subunit b
MQIDWFTFTAQVLNFLVLVWLLKRFLYGPIQRAIDERERTIAQRLDSAAERETAAAAAQESYEQQQAELAHLTESLLSDAAAEADQWRKERLQELRQEVAQARQTWHESLAREQQQFLGELRQRTVRQVQEVVRHVLQELADTDLEHQAVQQFLHRLDELLSGQWRGLQNGRAGSTIVVRTAFPLSPDDQKSLEQDLAGRMNGGPVHFEVDRELICGIELVRGDHKLEWNVDHYLESLERSIASAIDQHTLKHADAP